MNEYRGESQTLLLLSYLRHHPGLALSISYALLTLCGILYSKSFYDEFDIAILKLTDLSDLMIAGLSEPTALLMFCGGILITIGLDPVTKYFYKTRTQWQKKPKSLKRTLIMALSYIPKRSESVMLITIACFVLYAYLFVSLFADWHSAQIKQGYGEKVMVSSEVLGSEAKLLTLLGSTTHYLITYNPDSEQVTMIPVENIDKLSAVPPVAEK